MNKLFLTLVLLSMPSFTMMAQDDDLYFVPKKVVETNHSIADRTGKPTYYIGSNRNIDEYNHRGKFRNRYGRIESDSLSDDIIDYDSGRVIYSDAIYNYEDDYAYCRRMSRFDDYYGWYDPWFYGHWGYGAYWSARWDGIILGIIIITVMQDGLILGLILGIMAITDIDGDIPITMIGDGVILIIMVAIRFIVA